MATNKSVVLPPDIPDTGKLPAVRLLCESSKPYESPEAVKALFLEAMREISRWHLEHS